MIDDINNPRDNNDVVTITEKEHKLPELTIKYVFNRKKSILKIIVHRLTVNR